MSWLPNSPPSRHWTILSDFVERETFDERVISALHEVAMAGRVRRLRYEHAEGLTTQQAQRDLRELVAAGVLESVGRTGSRYHPAGRSFPEAALEIARTPIAPTSPYG